MPTSDARFAPGTVVRVPFPYADGETRHHRPALVVATVGSGSEPLLLWVLMITSAENRGWPGDVEIGDAAGAGLPAPSVIRTAKIATIDVTRAEPKGRVAPEETAATLAEIAGRLRLAPDEVRPDR
jgi:mRNA interferase MazF